MGYFSGQLLTGGIIMLMYFNLLQLRKARLSFIRAFGFMFFFTVIFSSYITNVHSAQVTVEWYPNSEADLAGYKLHYGTTSGNYDTIINVGNQVSYTIPNLEGGNTYYVTGTAYDTSGYESVYAEELIYNIPITNDVTPPSPPTGLRIVL